MSSSVSNDPNDFRNEPEDFRNDPDDFRNNPDDYRNASPYDYHNINHKSTYANSQYSDLVFCIFQNGMWLKLKADAFLFEQYWLYLTIDWFQKRYICDEKLSYTINIRSLAMIL